MKNFKRRVGMTMLVLVSLISAAEAKTLVADAVITSQICDRDYNDALLRTVQIALEHLRDNPACTQALNDYYKTATTPIKLVDVLQANNDGNQFGTSAPNGESCKDGTYVGYISYHCALELR